MLDQPPQFETENMNPDDTHSLTDSLNSKGGYVTPKQGEELREIKQLLLSNSNTQFENFTTPKNASSYCSKVSNDNEESAECPEGRVREEYVVGEFPQIETADIFEPFDSDSRPSVREPDSFNALDESDIVAPPLVNEIGSSFYDDSDSSEDEGLQDYKVGGYHAVHVGEIYGERYIVIQKLGWGHFSTVWLAKDLKYDTYVAMKVQKSASHYTEAAFDEVEILDQVSTFWKKQEWQDSLKKYHEDKQASGNANPNNTTYDKSSTSCHTVQLLNSFTHNGPNGMHFIMVFQILGVNLLEIIKRYDYRGVPVPIVRELTRQCLMGLDYLHRICKLIHTDLKPENVVISLTKKELSEIKNKGMLTTTKMYDKKAELIRKSVANATNIPDAKLVNDRGRRVKQETTNLHTDRSACDTNMSRKDKQKYRKNKKKKVKKYIKQGRLPANYSSLPQEEKDRLYNEVRRKVENENIQRNGLDINHHSEKDIEDNTGFDDLKGRDIDINIDATDVTLTAPSTAKLGNSQDKYEDKESQSNTKKLSFEIPKLKTDQIKHEETPNDVDVKTTRRGPRIDENAQLTIVDMGNGCWTHHHFTSQIQTRQYRSPETIIGVPYGTSADIWSMGCMVFELLTGDFVFEPKSGERYGKDDDHLAQMIELLGPMPKNMALSGKNSKKFFDSTGHLKRIRGLNYWPLERVLVEKYRFTKEEAEPLADFLKETFIWDPEKRTSAQKLLDHPWLKMTKNYNYKMSDDDYEAMMIEIKQKEENERRKKELELILRDGILSPEDLHRKLNSENNSELAEEDFEQNWADTEDFHRDDIFNSSDDSISLGYGDSDREEENLFIGGGYGKGKALNNSFTGPYGNMEHIHYDKGENTQFQGL